MPSGLQNHPSEAFFNHGSFAFHKFSEIMYLESMIGKSLIKDEATSDTDANH